MATLASTAITGSMSANGEQPLAFGEGGLLMECFRCAGGAVGDTIALTPKFIANIITVSSTAPATHGLTTTAANTNVTLTLRASSATNVNFEAWIIGRR